MNIFFKLWIVLRTLKWRLLWNQRNTHYRFTIADNPKFMGPRDAVKLIADGDVVMVPGLAGNQRISIMSWAIRELFAETGHPRDLTLISPGGQGGRGRAPGTLEEWAQEGLVTRFFSAHHETYKAFLDLAAQGKIELQCIPQGILLLLIEAAAQGQDSLLSKTGIGTFFDPRVGSGSHIAGFEQQQFIAAEENGLRYRLPPIDVALFNAAAADREGNIYVTDCAMFCCAKELVTAVKRRGGRTIANVGRIVPKDEQQIFINADAIDAIVFYPKTEQTATFNHQHPCKYFTEKADVDVAEGVEMVRLINRIFGLTPRRGPVAKAMGRLGAQQLAAHLQQNAYMNIGTGFPEEIFYMLYYDGWLEDKTVFTEAGAVGGVPAPGIFFGIAIAPREIISSPQIFQRAYKHLDGTVLGFLQVDSAGNVNASQRGAGIKGFVGPGGFIDFTCAAQNIFFIGRWMSHSHVTINGGKIHIARRGQPKFVDKVDQITFSGAEAVKAGKKVVWITDVGVFELTSRGIELIEVMPGIDVQRDIIDFAPAKILVAADPVPTVETAVVTGDYR